MIARLRRTYNHLIRSLMNRLLITTMKHPTTNPSFFFLGSVLKKSTPGKFTPIWYLKPVGILFRDKVFAAIAVFVKPKLPHIRRATSHKSSGHAGEQEQKQSFLNSFFMQIIPKNIVPPTWPLCRVVETIAISLAYRFLVTKLYCISFMLQKTNKIIKHHEGFFK